MNANRQVEVHYIDTGFPYTVTQSFMDLFEGLAYAQADVVLAEALQDQARDVTLITVLVMRMRLNAPRLDGERRLWENSAPSNGIDSPQIVVHGIGTAGTSSDLSTNHSTVECIRTNQNSNSPHQVIWQDNIDPDNMTYEDLLDLGEAVGTQSRGLSEEKISLLPVMKYKCSFFSRKKLRGERCVICQMDYKRGDRQIMLPCKHVYHSACVSRWLSINKACPVCFAEVFGDEPSQR